MISAKMNHQELDDWVDVQTNAGRLKLCKMHMLAKKLLDEIKAYKEAAFVIDSVSRRELQITADEAWYILQTEFGNKGGAALPWTDGAASVLNGDDDCHSKKTEDAKSKLEKLATAKQAVATARKLLETKIESAHGEPNSPVQFIELDPNIVCSEQQPQVLVATWVKRLTQDQGGSGSTPLHLWLLKKSEALLLAARFLLKRFPGLLLDKYDNGQEHDIVPSDKASRLSRWTNLHMKVLPTRAGAGPNRDAPGPTTAGEPKLAGERSDYYGENCLHLTIVNRLPEMLLFAESLECCADGGPPAEDAVEADVFQCGLPFLKLLAKGEAKGAFFKEGGLCDYGRFPLNFAAATGAPFWFFQYLVLHLEADLKAWVRHDGRRYTAMHFAVLHGKNESVRYLRMLQEKQREDEFNSHDGSSQVTTMERRGALGNHEPDGNSPLQLVANGEAHYESPLQLAAKLVGRCTQRQVVIPTARFRKLGETVRDLALSASPDYRSPDAKFGILLDSPAPWVASADQPPQPTMLEFLLDLERLVRHGEQVWEYGGIRKAYYDVHELMICDSSQSFLSKRSGIGRLLENPEGPSLLCPSGALDFLPIEEAAPVRLAGAWGLWRYFADWFGAPTKDEFRLGSKPGKQPPSVGSMIPLLIVERAWRRFGWRYVFYEFALFAVLLGLVIWTALGRVADHNPRGIDHKGRACPPPTSITVPVCCATITSASIATASASASTPTCFRPAGLASRCLAWYTALRLTLVSRPWVPGYFTPGVAGGPQRPTLR